MDNNILDKNRLYFVWPDLRYFTNYHDPKVINEYYKYKLGIRNNNEYVRFLEENADVIHNARKRNDRRFSRHYRIDCDENIDGLFFRHKLR